MLSIFLLDRSLGPEHVEPALLVVSEFYFSHWNFTYILMF